jgi:hypothetical protein
VFYGSFLGGQRPSGPQPLVSTVNYAAITSNLAYQPFDTIPSYLQSPLAYPNQTLGKAILVSQILLPQQLISSSRLSWNFNYLTPGERAANPNGATTPEARRCGTLRCLRETPFSTVISLTTARLLRALRASL